MRPFTILILGLLATAGCDLFNNALEVQNPSNIPPGGLEVPSNAQLLTNGAIPDFELSPDRLTSTSAGTESRRAADSESSEWQSSQIPFTAFALRLWRWPMKCQRKASP